MSDTLRLGGDLQSVRGSGQGRCIGFSLRTGGFVAEKRPTTYCARRGAIYFAVTDGGFVFLFLCSALFLSFFLYIFLACSLWLLLLLLLVVVCLFCLSVSSVFDVF